MKQPFELRAFAFKTGFMACKLQGENLLLFFLSPDVALANIIKFPSSPPGVQPSGSCCVENGQNGGLIFPKKNKTFVSIDEVEKATHIRILTGEPKLWPIS